MRLILFLTSFLSLSEVQALCTVRCQTTNCANLEYYMSHCNGCHSLLVGSKCKASFCQNHPELCANGRPLPNLTVNVPDVRLDENNVDRQHAICHAPVFKQWTFEGNHNSTLTPENLNTLTIVFFEQTKGDVHQRNIGSVRNVVANYFADIYPELHTMDAAQASEQVNLMIQMRFGKSLEKSTNLDFHNIIERVRREIFAKRGIPTQKVFEIYQNTHTHLLLL